MRVIWKMRAGAILAVSAALAVGALSGCGQRGPLYMPTVPPLPAKPNFDAQPTSATPATDASGVDADSVPDTSGTPLSLSPDSELSTPASAPAAASDAQPTE